MTTPSSDHPVALLSPYLDGALVGDERERVERHLAACAACRDHIAALRTIVEAVRAEATPPVPKDLAARVAAAIDAAKVVPLRRRLAVPVSIAATIAAVGLLVAYRWHESGPAIPLAPAREAVSSPQVGNEAEKEEADSDRGRVDERPTSLGYAGGQRSEPSAPAAPSPKGEPAAQRETKKVFENRVSVSVDEAGEGPAAAPVPQRETTAAARTPDAEDVANRSATVPAPSARGYAQAAKLAPTPCSGPSKDAGGVATWQVGDMQVALRELDALAAQEGGRGDRAPVASGGPYAIYVPRDRYQDLRDHLEARGVTDVPREAPETTGASCVELRVSIRVVLGAP